VHTFQSEIPLNMGVAWVASRYMAVQVSLSDKLLETEDLLGVTLELIQRPKARVQPEKIYPPET